MGGREIWFYDESHGQINLLGKNELQGSYYRPNSSHSLSSLCSWNITWLHWLCGNLIKHNVIHPYGPREHKAVIRKVLKTKFDTATISRQGLETR